MLRGSHPARVDEKGRLKIPAAFLTELREDDGEEFFVTSFNGQFVRVYPLREWKRIEERLATTGSMDRVKRKFLNLVNYYGQVVTMDKQGRILIPGLVRETAAMKGEVMVLGQTTFLDVWNRQRLVDDMRKNQLTADEENQLGQMGV